MERAAETLLLGHLCCTKLSTSGVRSPPISLTHMTTTLQSQESKKQRIRSSSRSQPSRSCTNSEKWCPSPTTLCTASAALSVLTTNGIVQHGKHTIPCLRNHINCTNRSILSAAASSNSSTVSIKPIKIAFTNCNLSSSDSASSSCS